MGQIVDIAEVLLEAGLSSSATETERAIIQSCLQKAEADVKKFLRYDPTQKTHVEYYPNQDFSLQSRAGRWEVDNNEAFIRRLQESATDELQLKHLPIRSITDLRIDYDGRSGTRANSFGVSTQKTEGVDFWANYDVESSDGNTKLCLDGVLRSEGRWPNLPGSVKVTYVAGYTDGELHGEEDALVDASSIAAVVIDETIARVQKVYSRMKKARGWAIGPLASESLGDYSYSQDTAALAKLISGGLMAETIERLSEFVNWGVELAS